MSPEPLNEQGAPSAPGGRLKSVGGLLRAAIAWSTANRKRTIMVAGACLASVVGISVGSIAIASRGSSKEAVTIDIVLDALDLGSYEKARELARKLKAQGDLRTEDLGAPVFALGAAAAYEAEVTWSRDKTKYYLMAVRYLEEARDRGFPPGRQAEGLFLLGKSLYLCGRIPASRPALLEALKINKDKKTEIHHLLAEAYFNDANPKLDKALEQNTLYLADRRVPVDARHRGLMQRAQILLRLGQIPECVATLDKIPSGARNRADAIIMRGQILMREAETLRDKPDATNNDRLLARQKYQKAIKVLRSSQGQDTLRTQATRKSMYLIGMCYLEMGGEFNRAAMEQFARTSRTYEGMPEGLAASFQEGELSRQLGRSTEALAAYRRTLSEIDDPQNYSNPWISLGDLRTRLLTAYQYYMQTNDFEVALQLAKMFYPVFSRAKETELTAETHRAWGRDFLKQARQMPSGQAAMAREIGRKELRQAGVVYSRLARLEKAKRRYPDDLWQSGEAYFEGQDYRNAVSKFQEYLKNESRRQRPQALVRLGEAMLALDRIDDALEAFEECVEFFPLDAAAFRARLLASKAFLEKGEVPKAEKLLQENLDNQLQKPSSAEWRDSKFALGKLMYIDGRYQEAARQLEEATARYPDDPKTLAARYMVADSYRQSARIAMEKLNQELAVTSHTTNSMQISKDFDDAVKQYEAIQQTLGRYQETRELTPTEKAIMRNSYYAIGDIQFDLGNYAASIKTYMTATNRYQNSPEVLLAYTQISNAYRRLNEPNKARAVLEQAKTVLARMKTGIDFNETTPYGRQEWAELLDSLSAL